MLARFVLQTIVLIGIFASLPVNAQRWEAKKLLLPEGGDSLEIHLTEAAKARHIIGFVVDPSQQETLELTTIGHMTATVGRIQVVKKLGSVQAPSESSYRFAGSRLDVFDEALSQETDSIGIFIRSRTPKRLKLFLGSTMNYDSTVLSGVIVQNGLVRSDMPQGMHQLLVMEAMPFHNAPAIRMRPYETRFEVNLLAARANLLEFKALQVTPGTVPGNGIVATLLIEINPNGQVSQISGHGKSYLSQPAVDALASWKFRPFLHQGKAVTAVLPLGMRIEANGNIHTGLEREAAVF